MKKKNYIANMICLLFLGPFHLRYISILAQVQGPRSASTRYLAMDPDDGIGLTFQGWPHIHQITIQSKNISLCW